MFVLVSVEEFCYVFCNFFFFLLFFCHLDTTVTGKGDQLQLEGYLNQNALWNYIPVGVFLIND